ncbi:MAG TPA: S41 family peptidase [Bacteroidales bacterium]|nr:S41 family peptidase [Bacteroidales bacterium]
MKIYKIGFKKINKIVIISVIVITSILSINFVNDDFEIAKNLDIYASLYRELNTYYVDELKPGELIKTSIESMLESLDPYTSFISESDLEDYKLMTTGQYGGIGALIHRNGDSIVISDPYEGFPAQINDIRSGDVILEVNGKTVNAKTATDVTEILRGQPGTTVKILLKREGVKDPIEKVVERAEVKIDNISYSGMINKTTGYIKLTNFYQNAGKEVKAAFLNLKEQGMTSCIIDLRDNGGGLLNEAVNIVNIFIDKGITVVSTKGKLKDKNNFHKTLNPVTDETMPLVVLVNRSSASASEIVTGAIQDLDRGVIIGERTYGKGLVQNVIPLSYNTKLKVTVAKYYIPSGRCIQAIDYSQKNEDGSVAKIPDSLKVAFKTKNNRIVYDGGGIEPDIYQDPYEYSNISVSLIIKYLIFDYATKYRSIHNTISGAKEFKVTDEIYTDFISFISNKEYDYFTKSEESLKELKLNAEKEKYYEDIKSEYLALESKMVHNKKEDLEKFKDEIKELLKQEIVSRYYFQKGRQEAYLSFDQELKKALEILKDSSTYNGLLNGSILLNKEK